MKLVDILTSGRVVSGTVVTSKKRALEEMSKLLAAGAGNVTEAEIFQSLNQRERLGSTGLGHGVAIPHGRMAQLEAPVGALIRLKHPVDYDAHDGQSVDLMFGLIVPQAQTDAHLKHLAAIAELFSDDTFCAEARAASDDAALYALLTSRA